MLPTQFLTLAGRTVQIGRHEHAYDPNGHRKYLMPAEREAFLKASEEADVREVRTFYATLAWTGCRISEALALTAGRIDLRDGAIVLESLKKRRAGVYRPIPVPPALLDTLNMVHNIRAAQRRRDHGKTVRLWNWSRVKGWYAVCAVMKAAKITGPHATPQGITARLRHQGRNLRCASQHPAAVAQARATFNHVHSC